MEQEKNQVDQDKQYLVALILTNADLERMKFELKILKGTAWFYPEGNIRDQLLAGVIIAAEEKRGLIKLKGIKK